MALHTSVKMWKKTLPNHQTTVFQEAAGEEIPILLLGNKMDMDGHREVSFKEAEQLAYVSSLQSPWMILLLFMPLQLLTYRFGTLA